MGRTSTALLWIAACVFVTEIFAQEEDQVYADLDQEKTLTCQSDMSADIEHCLWAGPVAGQQIWSHRPAKDGYRINYEPTTGICRLTIIQTTLSHKGVWTCTFPYSEIRKKIDVILVATPDPPVLMFNGESINNQKQIVDPNINGKVQVDCVSANGLPGPTRFEWKINGNDYQPDGPFTTPTPTDDSNGRVTATSTITLEFPTAEQRFHSYAMVNHQKEKEITCKVIHPAYKGIDQSESATASVGEKYDTTEVVIKLNSSLGEAWIVEGESVELYCDGDGNPEPTIFRYKAYKIGGNNEVLFDNALGQNYTARLEGDYFCEASNNGGQSYMSSKKLTVKYGAKPPNQKNESASTANTGLIIGIVVGALALLAIIGGVTMYTFKKRTLCFAGTHSPEMGGHNGTGENGIHKTKEEQIILQPEKKPVDNAQGDQNDNTKPKEVVYAELELSNGNNTAQTKPKSDDKTEYAQIKFQPKENQV